MRFDSRGRPIVEPTCPYQFGNGVLCEEHREIPEKCGKCGWNPRVAYRRLEKIKEEMRK